jgi:hypothetical protein
MTFTQIRPLLLWALAGLVALGWLPTVVADFIAAHAETFLVATMLLWGIVGEWRNRKEANVGS